MPKSSVLVSGASFAGLATAYWMKRAGYDVTVIETAPSIREGGTPVNIKGQTIEIAKRMGLFDEIVANSIATEVVEIWDSEGLVARSDARSTSKEDDDCFEYEIERDLLTRLMFSLVKDDVEIAFDATVSRLEEKADYVAVELSNGMAREFSLIFGCDGIHSNIRSLRFGAEADYSLFLNTYGSVTIVPRLLIEQKSLTMYQAPGRAIILSAHNGKTDIITLFSSRDRLEYDRHDRAQKSSILASSFEGAGWRVPELLEEIDRADNLYFSELAQIKMPAWTKGKVALVGDAAYCPSAAAGMGGSLAIDGAAALGDAFAGSGGDHEAAFRNYNGRFRSFVDHVQSGAVTFCEQIAIGTMADRAH